ncbi:hypothetical protein [Streptomyces sp. NPDC058255]|uniref:hypothetical protein n=1 Tax=Streptomyces sp. NPDC058255 TaxID=3346407 RepID=UPI0036EB85AB
MTTYSGPPTTVALPLPEILGLTEHFDTTGITSPDALADGGFNVWSNTFPADELPAPGSVVDVHGLPFAFPAKDPAGRDNLRCAGQLIDVPVGRYDWIHLLAAAERRTEDEALLHFTDGAVDPEWLRVSDFWPQTPSRFGESPAFTCGSLHYPRHIQRDMPPVIWRQRVAVPRESALRAVRLPDNPALHIFAMTLQPSLRLTAESATETAA